MEVLVTGNEFRGLAVLVIAVTGGLGAGKSTASEYLKARGGALLPLDDIAKRVTVEHEGLLGALAERFGQSIIGTDGTLDRPELARVAFASAEGAAALGALVHPPTLAETRRLLGAMATSDSPPPFAVVEVPLLVEAPALLDAVDEVLAISAPEELRVSRAMRSGRSEGDARQRIARQASDSERAAIADVVIDNGGDLESFLDSVARYYEERIAPQLPGS